MSARGIHQVNKWLSVATNMDPNEPTELVLSGFIGESFWDDSGNSGKDFRETFNAIPKGKKIVVKINSEGGVIKDGLEMYDAIASRAADVTTNLVGYACSTASWLGLAASKVVAADNAIVMIHNSSAYVYGNADEHAKGADMLKAHDKSIAGMLAKKTGKSEKQVAADMSCETWMTGKEAREYGIADEVTEGPANSFQGVAVNAPWMAKIPERFKTAAPKGANHDTPTNEAITASAVQPPVTDAASLLSTLGGGEPAGSAAGNHNAQSMKDNDTATAAATPPATQTATATDDSVRKLERKLATQAVNRYIDQGAITKQESTIWVDNMLKDEESTLKILDAKLPVTANSQPGSTVTVVADSPWDNIKKLPTAKARYKELRTNWEGLIKDGLARDDRRAAASPYVLNSNSYSSTLITAFLIDGAVTVLQNRWAPLRAFTRDFSTDPYKPLASGQLKTVTAGPTVQTGAASSPITNYESGDATVGVTTVNVLEYCSSVHVTSTELNSGLRMENLMTIGVAALANKIIEAATAPITLANFTAKWDVANNTNVVTAANFGFSNLAEAWGVLQKSPIKNLILDGTYLAKLLNVPTYFQSYGESENAWKAFGWDLIALNSDWTGASNNAVGFACNPQAITCLAGLPIQPPNVPGNTLQVGSFMVPEVEMAVQTAQWFALASRTGWFSWGAMFGAAKCDGTAGVVLASS